MTDPAQSTLDEWTTPADADADGEADGAEGGAREIPEDVPAPDAGEIHGTAVEAKAHALENSETLSRLVDVVEELTDDVLGDEDAAADSDRAAEDDAAAVEAGDGDGDDGDGGLRIRGFE